MATTISAPSESTLPGWLLAVTTALAVLAIVVLMAIVMDSDSTTTAPASRVAPESGQVGGSPDSIDRAPSPEPVTRVPGRAF